MKKYALYPGVGRIAAEMPLRYITGRQLAILYRVPYSECLDTDNPAIRRVINAGQGAIYLTRLLPMQSGSYRLPNSQENKLIVVQGLHEAVNKSG